LVRTPLVERGLKKGKESLKETGFAANTCLSSSEFHLLHGAASQKAVRASKVRDAYTGQGNPL
jgi:hypothetical protein